MATLGVDGPTAVGESIVRARRAHTLTPAEAHFAALNKEALGRVPLRFERVIYKRVNQRQVPQAADNDAARQAFYKSPWARHLAEYRARDSNPVRYGRAAFVAAVFRKRGPKRASRLQALIDYLSPKKPPRAG